MKTILILIALGSTLSACSQTSRKDDINVGGSCENCQAIYESPVPLEKLSWIDTLPDYNEAGPKMVISGVIYDIKGKPAKDVVLFIYHTDQEGIYPKKGNEKGHAKQQGYLRGWIKTNEKGEYKFYTLRPASYPNSNNPQHIHPTIKEPGKSEYWIDEFLFEDDPYLTAEQRSHHQQRGGNGVLTLKNENGLLVGYRDIYLGKNIPGYPTK